MSTVAFEKPQPVSEDQIDFVRSLPFIGVHVACLAAFLTGVSWNAVLLCISLYVIRMFGISRTGPTTPAGFFSFFSL